MTPLLGKCFACGKQFHGGVIVTALNEMIGERVSTPFCSNACAVADTFAHAIREAKEDRDFWKKRADDFEHELRRMRDAQPPGKRGRR